MPEISADTRFAFQPLVNLHTGGVIAMEMLARPTDHDVRSLLRSAALAGELERLDVALAVAAARCSSEHETLLPLHLNLTAETVAADGEVLAPLHHALNGTSRQASQTVLEINPPNTTLRTELVLAGLDRLRRLGYHIALDGVGTGSYPLTVIAEARPDLIKMDREIVAGLPHDSSCVVVLQALQHLASCIGAKVVAEGVERPDQLATLREHGVGIAQGYLLGPPNRRPTTHLQISAVAEFQAPVSHPRVDGLPGTRITDFMHPAITLPLSTTGEEVRAVLRDRPAVSGVVLVDEDGRPHCTLDRNRFLLAVSGAYGHALYAKREAARLGDEPRVLMAGSSAWAALELVRSSVAHRRYDDIVVLDSSGQCAGAICVGDVIHGVAQLHLEQAASLHPLTRLPGSSTVVQLVDRKIADRAAFAVSWLDVDELRLVNARSGFAGADDLIRELGRALTDAAQAIPSAVLAHIGGDDFVAICDPDDVAPLGSAVLDEPWEVDGHEVTLSMASLICLPGTVTGHREVSRMLARMRQRAKSMPTTSWVSGRPDTDQVEVLRGDAADKPPAGWPQCTTDQALLERRTG